MQKSNDNEIVQYLGVKHIINYLEVQVGLTQTPHFDGYLQYYVGRIWSVGGDGELCVCVCGGGGLAKARLGPSPTVCIHTCTHMSANTGVLAACVCACTSVYINTGVWVLVGG